MNAPTAPSCWRTCKVNASKYAYRACISLHMSTCLPRILYPVFRRGSRWNLVSCLWLTLLASIWQSSLGPTSMVERFTFDRATASKGLQWHVLCNALFPSINLIISLTTQYNYANVYLLWPRHPPCCYSSSIDAMLSEDFFIK